MADVFAAGGKSSLDNVLYKNEVTILGIGNVILRDEGFGVRVAEYRQAQRPSPPPKVVSIASSTMQLFPTTLPPRSTVRPSTLRSTITAHWVLPKNTFGITLLSCGK